MDSETPFNDSMDARDWARAFVEHVNKNPDIATDEGTMIGWFANAIMRGYDTARAKYERASPEEEFRRQYYGDFPPARPDERGK